MADLFDIKVGGAGWHITSHLIALVALFVACFAITGYITFRDDSIGRAALKDDSVAVELPGPYEMKEYVGYTSTDFKTQAAGGANATNFMTSQGVASSATGALILPKNARIMQVRLEVLAAVTGVTDIDVGSDGTTATSDDAYFDALALASIDTVGEVNVSTGSYLTTQAEQVLAQDEYVTVTANTTAVTAGELKISILVVVPV